MTVVMSAQSQTSGCKVRSSVNYSKASMFRTNIRVIQGNSNFLFELIIPVNCITMEALLKE